MRIRSSIVLALALASFHASRLDAQAGMPRVSFSKPTWTAAEPFTCIMGIRELRNASVVVTDVCDVSVHLVAPGGGSARLLGRTGSGPREYTTPTALIPLPGDTTLLLDRDAFRFLLIDPSGALLDGAVFPPTVGSAARSVRGADREGRIYYAASWFPPTPSGPPFVDLLRWNRRTGRIDTVASIHVPHPESVKPAAVGGVKITLARRVIPFALEDDWAVAPSGRLVLVRAEPYHVEWRDAAGRITRSDAVKYQPVPMTEADKKKRREPNGPPYVFAYPATKSPFALGTVVDDRDNVWVRRHMPASSTQTQYDVFGADGKLLGAISLSGGRRILAVTSRFAYVVRTDDVDQQWLEAYARAP